MNFKKWVKSIQTAGYNGARTVLLIDLDLVEFQLGWQDPDRQISNQQY